MLTAIVLKALYSVGGAVVGWFLKKWHVKPLIDAVDETLRRVEENTPNERPSK